MLQDVWRSIDEGQYQRAEDLLRSQPELLASRAGQMALGYIQAHTRRFGVARELFHHLREQHRGDPWEHIAIHQQGRVERLAGEHQAALDFFHQELELIGQLDGDAAHELAVNALERSISLRALGRLSEARDALTDCLNRAGLHDPETIGRAERELAELCLTEGHSNAAKLHLERAVIAFRESEDEFAVRQLEARLHDL